MEKIAKALLAEIGEDPSRQGLKDTPRRFSASWQHLTSGYALSAEEELTSALFDEDCRDMVIVRNIEFYSMCEHHMLPFWGKAHIAYLPTGKVVGLSKLPRVLNIFARRLQVQERLTNQVATSVMQATGASGVGVIVEAQHMCMMMRGVRCQNSSTVTSCMLGSFRDQPETRNEFLSLVKL